MSKCKLDGGGITEAWVAAEAVSPEIIRVALSAEKQADDAFLYMKASLSFP